ncbi:hypothetical protein BJY04DRAFT_216243 [Aspergillus karnatakaensis]|uniref:DUF3716 domain-containing protein n=1 Tax=Aspergillus karnatakaensis TaxID=1810916 RepID=UPI003CCCEFFD
MSRDIRSKRVCVPHPRPKFTTILKPKTRPGKSKSKTNPKPKPKPKRKLKPKSKTKQQHQGASKAAKSLQILDDPDVLHALLGDGPILDADILDGLSDDADRPNFITHGVTKDHMPYAEGSQITPEVGTYLARQAVRSLDWHLGRSGEPLFIGIQTDKERLAAFLQTRGQEAEKPCASCVSSRGVWKTCIIDPLLEPDGDVEMTCANCIYSNFTHLCEYRNKKLNEDPASANRETAVLAVEDGLGHDDRWRTIMFPLPDDLWNDIVYLEGVQNRLAKCLDRVSNQMYKVFRKMDRVEGQVGF